MRITTKHDLRNQLDDKFPFLGTDDMLEDVTSELWLFHEHGDELYDLLLICGDNLREYLGLGRLK